VHTWKHLKSTLRPSRAGLEGTRPIRWPSFTTELAKVGPFHPWTNTLKGSVPMPGCLPADKSVFVDLGAGIGRVLWHASFALSILERPVGIEICHSLEAESQEFEKMVRDCLQEATGAMRDWEPCTPDVSLFCICAVISHGRAVLPCLILCFIPLVCSCFPTAYSSEQSNWHRVHSAFAC
jgi:hypothetical protein